MTKTKQRENAQSNFYKEILNIQNLVPGNGAKNLIACKCTAVVVQIKCRPTETSFWIIKFSTLKFAKRNQIQVGKLRNKC